MCWWLLPATLWLTVCLVSATAELVFLPPTVPSAPVASQDPSSTTEPAMAAPAAVSPVPHLSSPPARPVLLMDSSLPEEPATSCPLRS